MHDFQPEGVPRYAPCLRAPQDASTKHMLDCLVRRYGPTNCNFQPASNTLKLRHTHTSMKASTQIHAGPEVICLEQLALDRILNFKQHLCRSSDLHSLSY